MWTAENWKDYRVLDTSDGEKLEDWGGYKLIRPDPQVIWQSEMSNPYWKHPNARYHRSSKGGGEWEFFDLPDTWDIGYELGTGLPFEKRRISFRLKPFAFKHTGVFPEQAVNWDFSYGMIRKRLERLKAEGNNSPVRVLNLFAYTGGATLAAAAAGASVTHVDASRGMVSWAKENAALSGLSEAPVRWLVDDCTKFVMRELRRGNRYDVIIMDPPSYGRGPKGEIWKIEDSIFPFLKLCSGLLSSDPLFVLINSYTTGLQPGVLTYMLKLAFGDSFEGHAEASEIGLPVDIGAGAGQRGLILPEGASGRFIGNI